MTLSEFIQFAMKKNNINAKELSSLCGLQQSYISKFLNGKLSPSAEVLKAIAKTLNLKYEVLLMKAGILDEESIRHIIAPDTLKSFISETINLNQFSEDDLMYLLVYFKTKLMYQNEKLLLGDLVQLIFDLKDRFILPVDYKEIKYSDGDSIEVNKNEIEYLQSKSNSYIFSKYNEGNNDIPVIFGFDTNANEIDSSLKYPLDSETSLLYKNYNKFWYSPAKNLDNLYLIVKDYNFTNHSTILIKHGPLVAFAKITKKQVDKFVIINIDILDYFKDINKMSFCPILPNETKRNDYINYLKNIDNDYKDLLNIYSHDNNCDDISRDMYLNNINNDLEKKYSTLMFKENNPPSEFSIIGLVVKKVEKV